MTHANRSAELGTRSTFRHWARVPLRYCDQDALGHVNNGAVPMCLEQARVELVYPVLKAHGGGGIDLVIARVVIDYLAEMHYPGTIEIGTRIVRLGTKSLSTEHGLFMAGSDACVSTAQCVLVFFDARTRSALAPPGNIRRAIERLAG